MLRSATSVLQIWHSIRRSLGMQLPLWTTRNVQTPAACRQAMILPFLCLAVPALFLSPAIVCPLCGQPPATAARYMGREIATTMHYTGADWLMRESRQREEDCQRLLKELHVKPGQVICDMGCGNGFYTLKLAQLTGKTGKRLCGRHPAGDARHAPATGQGGQAGKHCRRCWARRPTHVCR